MKSDADGREETSRWERAPRRITIAVMAIIVVALAVNVVTAVLTAVGFLGYVALLLCAVGVVLGLRYRYLGLALVACAAPLAVLGGLVSTGLWSIACFAAFVFVLRGSSAIVVGGLIAVSNFVAAGTETGTIDVRVDSTASVAAFAAVVAAAIGSSVRGSFRYRREVEQRIRESEANRVTAVERGIAQERLRIARDLHDSVGHQVAVVNMRLGAAEVHLPPGADATRDDLAAARAGVQAVLRETQEILRVLRVDDHDDVDGPSQRLQPLRDLVASYRDAGLSIEDSVEELDDGAPAPSRAAVYRIVQEGLTNAQKHGVGAVSVTVRRSDGEMHVELVNRRAVGRRNDRDIGGKGLIGMHERAESAGGSIDSRSDGRLFWLSARIPLDREHH